MSESDPKTPARLRSEIWFNDKAEPGETAIYLERYSTYGLGRKELQSGRPVSRNPLTVAEDQTGSMESPCSPRIKALTWLGASFNSSAIKELKREVSSIVPSP